MDTFDQAVPGAEQPVEPVPPQQPQNRPDSVPAYVNPSCSPYWQAAPAYTYQPPVYVPPAPAAEPKKKQKKSGFWKTVLISTVVAVVSCGITAVIVSALWQQRSSNLSASFDEKLAVLREELEDQLHIGTGDSVSGSPGPSQTGGLTPGQVYARNVKAVVAISCTVTEDSFGFPLEGTSSGSGFVLTEDGYIASNYHVVTGADNITVTWSDGTQHSAVFVGGDESNDIALLKVEATGLQCVNVGRSDALIVGDQVAAIGNPLGELASTLTVGYISAKDRVITTDGTQINMLQTDAAINPGNSGGPLFNMKGEVIGITTAKYSGITESGASIEGIGFAIPIDDVIDMLDDLRVHGYITGAYLGVSVSNVDPLDASLYGLPLGVLVRDVAGGSCAQKGGVKSRDIITNLGGYKIENMNDLTRALRKFDAGQTVTMTVYRSGSEVQLSLTLDEKPQAGQ